MTLRLVGGNTLAGSLNTEGAVYIGIGSAAQFVMAGEALFSGDTVVNDGAWSFSSGTNTTFDAGSFVNIYGDLVAADVTAGILRVNSGLFLDTGTHTSIAGTLTVSGGVSNFTTRVNLHSDVHLNGTTYLEGALALTGAGTIQERVVIGANADSTYSVSTADLVYIPLNGVTAARTYFLDEAGAANGKKIRFHREDNHADRPIELKRSSDGSRITILNWDISGQVWTDVQRINGVWQRVGGHFWTS